MPGNCALRPRDAPVAEPDLLLDTDVLIEILRGSARASTWLGDLGNLTIGISVLTRMEVLQGARNRREQEILMGQRDNYHLVLLAARDSAQALSWFEDYHLSHGVGVIDCLIAASASRVGKPLHTFNAKHYRVIPEVNAQKPYSP